MSLSRKLVVKTAKVSLGKQIFYKRDRLKVTLIRRLYFPPNMTFCTRMRWLARCATSKSSSLSLRRAPALSPQTSTGKTTMPLTPQLLGQERKEPRLFPAASITMPCTKHRGSKKRRRLKTGANTTWSALSSLKCQRGRAAKGEATVIWAWGPRATQVKQEAWSCMRTPRGIKIERKSSFSRRTIASRVSSKILGVVIWKVRPSSRKRRKTPWLWSLTV